MAATGHASYSSYNRCSCVGSARDAGDGYRRREAMNPLSDEQRVEARARSAHDVRFHAIADSDDPILAERGAASPLGKRQRPVIRKSAREACRRR